jgi:putative tryptophan/tyrosine transport system ATP-binding protein
LKAALTERVRRLNLGLEDRLGNTIGSLSGGQRQALTLLMATWVRPKLLLLDGHTAALDPKSADQVIRLTEDIVSRDKLTTLIVTHSMQQAASLGDRLVICIEAGLFTICAEPKSTARGWMISWPVSREVRRREQLDESAAEMLRRGYV